MSPIANISKVLAVAIPLLLSSASLPGQQRMAPASFTFSPPKSGLRVGLAVMNSDILLKFEALAPTNDLKECVVFRRYLFGNMRLVSEDGRTSLLRLPEVNKPESYPAMIEWDFAKVRSPHRRDLAFILHTNESASPFVENLFRYFEIKKAGSYDLTLKPTVYLRVASEGFPVKFQRVDVSAITAKVMITEEMISSMAKTKR
jgi:hypothetical protein